MNRNIEPVYIAVMLITAPSVPKWVLGLAAIALISLSGCMFWRDYRKKE